ncbi:hypothetical protein [Leptolyngbya sp. KIOST-1]|uniref:hypothetical protein n=1 Tax=Leptolyngbya sp. KIOST-1 TaxID=1229172 RepID=UPI00056661F9|nr:hypothetical protein [Leptolyngbya sp. KIOST-1]
MPLTLRVDQLYSRRGNLLNRVQSAGQTLLDNLRDAAGRVIKALTWGNIRGFLVGAVLAQIPSMLWSLTGLWSVFTNAAIELYYFDWNIPDDNLDRMAQQRWNSFGGIAGGTVGSAIGYFACGIVPATSLMAFDERLAAHVLREVGEEAWEEVSFQFTFALRMAVRNMFRQTAGWLYKGARRWLKQPGNPVARAIFGNRLEAVQQKWGEAEGQAWSFAQAVDEQVERIPSQFWQNFTEEVIEEAIDSCIEAGYVLLSSVEGYYAAQKAAQLLIAEETKVVEIIPNGANDSEAIVLAGPESEIRGQIPAVLAHHQLIESRDVGQLVGQPFDDYVRARPFEGFRLQFALYSKPAPPYAGTERDRLVRVAVQVSDVDRTKIDWERLILCCGGRNGYLWGRFRAHAVLTNNRPLTVYGGTPAEAEGRLKAFLTLTNSEIRTISVTEEKREGSRLKNPKMYKETTRVYPGHLTIINRERLETFDRGQRSLDGNYFDKKARIDLWRETRPADFEDTIRELLRRSAL